MIGLEDLLDIVATEAAEGAGVECVDYSGPEAVHQQLLREVPVEAEPEDGLPSTSTTGGQDEDAPAATSKEGGRL